MLLIDVGVPGRVWEDFLDPMTSGMQAELGLPEPEIKKAGKGRRFVYRDVPITVALDLAGYLAARGDTLLGQGIDDPYDPEEKAARDTLRAGVTTAAKIRSEVQRARVLAGTSAGILDTSKGTMR
jgi:hypothetical protein